MKAWYSETLQENSDPELRRMIAHEIRRQVSPQPVDRVGCVVEFQHGREARIGVFRAPARHGRAWVAGLDGKKRQVEERRLLHVARHKLPPGDLDETRRGLRQIDRRRRETQERIDLHPLWELTLEEADRWWTMSELAEVFCAGSSDTEADDEAEASLARALADGRYFSMRDGRFQALPVSAVRRRLELEQRRRAAALRLEGQAAWLRAVADGAQAAAPAGAEEAIALLEQVVLAEGEDVPDDAVELMRRAHLHGAAAAFETLVRLGHWDADENLDLHRAGVTESYAPETIEAAGSARVSAQARRWWGRQVWGWAAEGEVCERVFSLRRVWGGYRLGIHSCAVALWTDASSAIEAEAAARGTTLQLPDRRIGILPPALEKKAVFRAGERQWALSLVLRLGADFSVRDVRMRLSRVRPHAVLPPGQIPPLFGQLVEARQRQRQEAGALLLPPDEDESVLLHELSHLAAEQAGAWCRSRGLSALYRGQAAPETRLAGAWEADRLHEQHKYIARPLWGTDPAPDALAGLEQAVPWDRPLRSYLDLLMQRQIVHDLRHGSGLYGPEQWRQWLDGNAWSRETAARVERRARRYWGLKALEGRVGERVEAVAVERLGAAFLLQLEGGVKALLPPGRETSLRVGQRVKVRLSQASARRDEVRLALA